MVTGPVSNAMKAMGSGVAMLYAIANNLVFPFGFVLVVHTGGVAFCWLSTMRERVKGKEDSLAIIFYTLRAFLWASFLLLLMLSHFLGACLILATVLKGLCTGGKIAGKAFSSLQSVVLGTKGSDFFGDTVIGEYCDAAHDAAGNTKTVCACCFVMILANVMMLSATSAGKARLNAFFEEKPEKPSYGSTDSDDKRKGSDVEHRSHGLSSTVAGDSWNSAGPSTIAGTWSAQGVPSPPPTSGYFDPNAQGIPPAFAPNVP